MNRRALFMVICTLATTLCFQQFVFFEPVSRAVIGVILKAEYLIVDSERMELRESRSLSSDLVVSSHAISVEHPGDPLPRIIKSGPTTSVIQFRTNLFPPLAKARSEIRVRNADVEFSDSALDRFYYSSFDIFLPNPSINTFDVDRTNRGDWNILWQCAQTGSAPPHYARVSSPPLSLQLYNQRLYVTTIEDYYPWSGARSNASIFNNWTRERTQATPLTPEIGDGEPLRHSFNYVGYLRHGEWNRVFMKFRLGIHGSYRIWVNGDLVSSTGPIGYRTVDNPFDPDPVYTDAEGRHIRKKCSVRFGIYQGYGNPLNPENPTTTSEVWIRRFAIGTDWNAVKFDYNLVP